MEKIIIIVEKSADYYDAYAENCDGIFGAGETAEAAKENALEGLRLFVSSRDKKDIPAILQGEYEIEFKYDTQSFLNYYHKILNCAALERISGINQKQLNHYLSGHQKPRAAQRKKLESALHRLGNELIAVKL